MRDRGLDFATALKAAQELVMPKPIRPSTSRAWTPRTKVIDHER